MTQERTSLWKGLLFWFLSTIVFKLILNTLFFFISSTIYIAQGISRKSWTHISMGIGTMLYENALLHDQAGNVMGGVLYEKTLLKDQLPEWVNGVYVKFGSRHYTVSRMVGVHAILKNLDQDGKNLRWLLAKVLEKKHSIKSVSEADRHRLLNSNF